MINVNQYVPIISRFLISLIFIIDGLMKLYSVNATLGAINSPGVTLGIMFTILITFIQLTAAGFFVTGHRICASGSVLIGFAILATIFSLKEIFIDNNLMIALQNIAIIGGILYLSQSCTCGTCPPKVKELHRKYHKKLMGLEPFDTPTTSETTETKQETPEPTPNTQA